MKRFCHFILIIIIAMISHGNASPAKRLIIQFSHELSATEQTHFRQQLDEAVMLEHRTIEQGTRWLLSLPQDASNEQLAETITAVSKLEHVSFVEEDRLMKPLMNKPVIQTQ